MPDKKEIEIKYPVTNADEIINTLNKGAEFKYEARQVDKYYNPPHRDFTKHPDGVVYEYLRLRSSDKGDSINYKTWAPRTHAEEYESNISSLKDLERIFDILDIKLLVTVDKIRKVWKLGDVEVCIDSVKELGDNIELEYQGDEEDVEAARAILFSTLEKLGAKLGEIDTRGYAYNMLIKKGLVTLAI